MPNIEQRAFVVTDSGCMHPASPLVQELDITVIPHHILHAKQDTLVSDIPDETFYTETSHEKKLQVAPPTTSEIQKTYTDLHRTSGDILSIHIGSHLSNTIHNVQEAADAYMNSVYVSVIDTATIGPAAGLIVTNAARLAEKNVPLREMEGIIETQRKNINMTLLIDETPKNGHQRKFWEKQSIFPPSTIIEMHNKSKKNGKIKELVSAKIVKKSKDPLRLLREQIPEYDSLASLLVFHTNAPEEKIRRIRDLLGTFAKRRIPVVEAGPTVATFMGVRTIGVVYERR